MTLTPANLFFAMSRQPAAGDANPLMSFLPIILIFVIFFFLIIRPQQKRQQQQKAMLNALSKGDKIVTSGGLYATVQHVSDDKVVALISEGVKVEIARASVAARLKSKS